VSLDHDLGDDSRGTGYDVLTWIEKEVHLYDYEPPELFIHSANTVAKAKMNAAICSILNYSP
jgi:hypothetical protein